MLSVDSDAVGSSECRFVRWWKSESGVGGLDSVPGAVYHSRVL